MSITFPKRKRSFKAAALFAAALFCWADDPMPAFYICEADAKP
jgi:hypothetical protein